MVLWVFGYGSLVWNPGFDFDERIVGFIKDYRRVFDLACIDHRGTPANPARTCTLEAKSKAVCWGAAYCVKGGQEKEQAAMQYLERRECEYDTKVFVDFYKEDDPFKPAITGVLVFISTPDKEANRYYLGPAPLQDMARQIATASGPCGNNRDYLFLLEKAMLEIGFTFLFKNLLRTSTTSKCSPKEEKLSISPQVFVLHLTENWYRVSEMP